jgi:transcription elongation GreA/GreB family factor
MLGKSAGDVVEFVAPRGLELKQVERVDYNLLMSAQTSAR